MSEHAPVIWSIAGHDTSGGAGLSADQRAADAMGVHLCPIVASITAQHSMGVQAVFPVGAAQLQRQLQAIADDMPPRVIKAGLLGSVAAIEVLARWVDHMRVRQPDLALVIDPVLGATAGGAAFANDDVLWAYRRELVPRATLITPNRAEARRLLGLEAVHGGDRDELPALAARLRQMGAQGVVITGGDAPDAAWAIDWLDVPQAQGWLCAPRVATPHHHGSGCTFATAAAAAMATGHGSADAIVLGKMLTHRALMLARACGEGAGPVHASCAHPLGTLPWLGLGRDLPWQLTHGTPVQPLDDTTEPPARGRAPLFRPFEPPEDGLYGILPSSAWIGAAASAGLRCLQLRHKQREGAQAHIEAAARHCAAHGSACFVNDHWREALALPPIAGLRLGLHLGQEDLLALDAEARQSLLDARDRVMLGISSHSVWELARAAGCGPSAIACGPVQATTTKDMPWIPQGEHNLRWWTAHSPAPVLAIGGLLTPGDLSRFAACGPATLCVVRALGATPGETAMALPRLRQAVVQGRQGGSNATAIRAAGFMLPHPVL